jgi:hypothetical protein
MYRFISTTTPINAFKSTDINLTRGRLVGMAGGMVVALVLLELVGLLDTIRCGGGAAENERDREEGGVRELDWGGVSNSESPLERL